jgi:VanZ family protein
MSSDSMSRGTGSAPALATRKTSAISRVLFVLAVAGHLAVLYWPRSPSTGGLPIDKVVHAVIFGMVLWFAARAALPVWPVAAVLAVHAVVSELIQHYVLSGRSGDPADSVADLAGVLIVTAFLWRRK